MTATIARGWRTALLLLVATAALSSAATGEKALSAPEQAKLLTAILDRTARETAAGKKPAAAFDIDDTLLLTAPRSKAILAEFAKRNAAAYPGLAEKVAALVPEKMPHGIVANLQLLGIDDPEKRKEIIKFWRPSFMGKDFLAQDWPIPGALDYIRKLRDKGASIYYVTARPLKTMREPTEAALKIFGFPLDEKAILVMNSENQAAPPFKGRVMDDIEKTHVLTGLFENEPDNLNAMHQAAPTAQPVFIDTVHTAAAGPLDPGIPRIKNYELGGE